MKWEDLIIQNPSNQKILFAWYKSNCVLNLYGYIKTWVIEKRTFSKISHFFSSSLLSPFSKGSSPIALRTLVSTCSGLGWLCIFAFSYAQDPSASGTIDNISFMSKNSKFFPSIISVTISLSKYCATFLRAQNDFLRISGTESLTCVIRRLVILYRWSLILFIYSVSFTNSFKPSRELTTFASLSR